MIHHCKNFPFHSETDNASHLQRVGGDIDGTFLGTGSCGSPAPSASLGLCSCFLLVNCHRADSNKHSDTGAKYYIADILCKLETLGQILGRWCCMSVCTSLLVLKKSTNIDSTIQAVNEGKMKKTIFT